MGRAKRSEAKPIIAQARTLQKALPMKLTAIIEREGDGYVALCPELDITSQGDSIEEARDNLREAVELFFECASFEEVKQRFGNAAS